MGQLSSSRWKCFVLQHLEALGCPAYRIVSVLNSHANPEVMLRSLGCSRILGCRCLPGSSSRRRNSKRRSLWATSTLRTGSGQRRYAKSTGMGHLSAPRRCLHKGPKNGSGKETLRHWGRPSQSASQAMLSQNGMLRLPSAAHTLQRRSRAVTSSRRRRVSSSCERFVSIKLH